MGTIARWLNVESATPQSEARIDGMRSLPSKAHSARRRFCWSRADWFLTVRNFVTNRDRFPELARLRRFSRVMPVARGALLCALGAALARWLPGLETTSRLLWVLRPVPAAMLLEGQR